MVSRLSTEAASQLSGWILALARRSLALQRAPSSWEPAALHGDPPVSRRTVGLFRGTLSAAPVLAHDILGVGTDPHVTDAPRVAEVSTVAANGPGYLRLVPADTKPQPWERVPRRSPPRPARVPPSAPMLYEELHPYGCSAYRGVSYPSAAKASA